MSASSIQNNNTVYTYNNEELSSKKKTDKNQENITSVTDNSNLQSANNAQFTNVDSTNKVKSADTNPNLVSFNNSRADVSEKIEQIQRLLNSSDLNSKNVLLRKMSEVLGNYNIISTSNPVNTTLLNMYSKVTDQLLTALNTNQSGRVLSDIFVNFAQDHRDYISTQKQKDQENRGLQSQTEGETQNQEVQRVVNSQQVSLNQASQTTEVNNTNVVAVETSSRTAGPAPSFRNNGAGSVRRQEQQANFNKSANAVSVQLSRIHQAIENSPHKTILTEKLSQATAAFEQVLNQRPPNPRMVALYSSLMNKLTDSINSGASGEEISKIFSDYQTVVDAVNTSRGSGRGRTPEKTEASRLLRQFLGNESFNALKQGIAASRNETPQSGEGEIGMSSFSGGGAVEDDGSDLDETEGTDYSRGFSAVSTTDNVTDEDVVDVFGDDFQDAQELGQTIFSISQEDCDEIAAMSADDIKQAIESIPGLNDMLKDLHVLNNQLIKDQVKLLNYEYEDSIGVSTYSEDSAEHILNERVNETIAESDRLEAELNLEIEKGEDVSSLLSRFREIISNLDLDLRENSRKTNESSFISNSNQSYIRDMKLRLAGIDKIKAEINEIYTEIQQNRANKDHEQFKLLNF